MPALWEDLCYGVRLLWRHPSFSVLALLTLAFGIGANTAVFSIVRGVLLRPLPYKDSAQLVWIGGRETRIPTETSGVSMLNLLELRARARTFSSFAGYSYYSNNLIVTGLGEPEQIAGLQVTTNFFDVLGVPAALGRTFASTEDQRGGVRVTVLSHDMWTRNYGGDPAVIGKNIILSSTPHQVVGVMPPGFQFPSRVDLWLVIPRGAPVTLQRESHGYFAIGRLAANSNLTLARQDLASLSADLEREYPASNVGYRFDPLPLSERVTGSVRETLILLSGITAFLLLIISANVANLMLSHAATRHREVAIRQALGAPRSAVLRQLLTESLLLSVAGGLLGSLLAWWAVRLLNRWNPPSLPRASELSVDPAALGFALAVSFATALLFGLAPALQTAKIAQAEALRESGARGSSQGAGGARLRDFFVVVEIALAIVLLAGAGLLLESLRQLLNVDPGFRSNGVLTAELSLPTRKFRTLAGGAAFVETYAARLRTLPGVVSAGASLGLPMGSVRGFYEFFIQGDPIPPIPHAAGFNSAAFGYFETMRIPLMQGRYFDSRDGADSPKAVIVSEPLARIHFAGRNPVGHRLRILTGGTKEIDAEIVGVVGGVRHQNLSGEPEAEIYFPLSQHPFVLATVVVNSAAPRETLTGAMKQTLKEMDRDMPLNRIRTIEEVILESASGPRTRGFFTAMFATAALLLASIGIYSVMSYAVSRRVREIGIRMAVGATPASTMRMIIRESGKLVFAGLGIGLTVTLALGRTLGSLLYGVSAFDPVVLALVCALLIVVALAATSIPAWRAAHIDPIRALRED